MDHCRQDDLGCRSRGTDRWRPSNRQTPPGRAPTKGKGSSMHELSTAVADRLGKFSSRRTFIRFAGASALATGLALGGNTSIAEATGCLGCGGGFCSSCSSPAPACPTCPSCSGFCPSGYTLQAYWTVCIATNNCALRCVECCKNGSGCHCWVPLSTHCSPGGGGCPC